MRALLVLVVVVVLSGLLELLLEALPLLPLPGLGLRRLQSDARRSERSGGVPQSRTIWPRPPQRKQAALRFSTTERSMGSGKLAVVVLTLAAAVVLTLAEAVAGAGWSGGRVGAPCDTDACAATVMALPSV
jgi:hypothetical protein